MRIKEIDEYCKGLQTELMLIEEMIKGLEAEADKLEGDIRTSVLDFVEKDRLKTSDKS
ncbi:MAG: hypothetical protein K5779_06170 [Saccharofermentans sp.]|nr:hypothetical protein [Saccharofermentans sp.]